MDFSFSEEQEALRELARKILGDLSTPARAAEIEKSDEWFDRELWAELARANLLGASLPEAQGGSGYGFFELCLLLQEQGRVVAPLPLHGTLVAAFAIARFGSEEQKQSILPRVAGGDALLSLALAEEGNDDLAAPTAAARREGTGWRLDGAKIGVQAAPPAERILVTARTEEDRAAVFLVDPSGEGVTLERQVATHREPLWWVTFAGAEAEVLPDAAAAWLADRAVAGLCAIQLGVSERALEMTAEYGRAREQFDRPIGSFQAFHQRAGDAYINVEAIRLSLWQAAFRLEREEPPGDAVDVAKFWACEGGQFVGYAAQHLHGGIGSDVDYPLHRYYMWAKHLELSLGSAHRALARIGAAEAAGDV
jgi:alkylation response protein AidB-like acyl-CoA dehydrogenase